MNVFTPVVLELHDHGRVTMTAGDYRGNISPSLTPTSPTAPPQVIVFVIGIETLLVVGRYCNSVYQSIRLRSQRKYGLPDKKKQKFAFQRNNKQIDN